MCIAPIWGVAFLLRTVQSAADCQYSFRNGSAQLRFKPWAVWNVTDVRHFRDDSAQLPNPGQMAYAVSTASCGQPQSRYNFLLRWMEQVVVTNLLLERCPFHLRLPHSLHLVWAAANILQHCLPFPSFVSYFSISLHPLHPLPPIPSPLSPDPLKDSRPV